MPGTLCSALKPMTLAGGENGLKASLLGVVGTDSSAMLRAGVRKGSRGASSGARSMKKAGFGGWRGGGRLDPWVDGGAWGADPCEEEAREEGADEVDIADGWCASVRTRVGLKESSGRPWLEA